MNKTEQAYTTHLEQRKLLGEVAWFKHEGVKVKLADGCFYSADFAVMLAGGQLELHEVKGRTRKAAKDGSRYDAPFSMDDSKVKVKTAAELFPFTFKLCYPATGGGWHEEDV